VPDIVAGICPYLMAEGGAWRAARPMRDQVCTAVTPAEHVTPEKQRRLCLVSEHLRCPTYENARETRALMRGQAPPALQDFDARVERRVPRSAAVALDRPTAIAGSRSLVSRARGLSKIGLAAMMLGAAALLIGARFMGGGSPGPTATASPSGTAIVASASPSPTPSASPTPRDSPTPAPSPTPALTASPTPGVSPLPTPASTQTYVVKAGDTLGGIATKFQTTVAVLQSLNNITDVARIRIGQVLKIP
jgi:LysM repeat protein